MKTIMLMLIMMMGSNGYVNIDETHVMINYDNEAVAIIENQGEVLFYDNGTYRPATHYATVACIQPPR